MPTAASMLFLGVSDKALNERNTYYSRDKHPSVDGVSHEGLDESVCPLESGAGLPEVERKRKSDKKIRACPRRKVDIEKVLRTP